MANPVLSQSEMLRYSRQIKLPGFGLAAQARLKNSKALIIGAGGLGCPIGLYLAGAGVGCLGVADFDCIEIHNLHRQIAHQHHNQGMPKAESLVSAMRALNPSLQYCLHPGKVDADNVLELVSAYDLVLDGSDNYSTRYLVADACFLAGKPLVYGAIHQFEAQISLFVPGKGPCYRCLFPQAPDPALSPSCSAAGVLGVLPGMVGTAMAGEAVKWLAQCGPVCLGELVLLDARELNIRKIRLGRDPQCRLCGDQPQIKRVVLEPVREAPLPDVPQIPVSEAKIMWAAGVPFLDVREPGELDLAALSGARHIPLNQLKASDIDQFKNAEKVVVFCHKGVRSRRAVARLLEWGLGQCVSMDGGIDAWAQATAESMVRY